MSKMLGITVCFVKVSLSKIKFQDVLCDAIQPLFGTEVFAQEIIFVSNCSSDWHKLDPVGKEKFLLAFSFFLCEETADKNRGHIFNS